MNHILTGHDLTGEHELHTAVFIAMLEDLGLCQDTMKRKRTLKNWIPQFRGFMAYLEKQEYVKLTTFKPLPLKEAIMRWSTSDLDSFNCGDGQFKRPRQLKYNIAVKRWLDNLYWRGDAILSAAIVCNNPGLVSEMASKGGLTNKAANNSEMRLMRECRRILEELDKMLLSDYTSDFDGYVKIENVDVRRYEEEIS